jgi:hypothetical protein
MGVACRAHIARHSFDAATTGLVAACQSLTPRRTRAPRVVACCGGMVIVSGLERMTFEVLSVVRKRGGSVHCIVNSWENHRIVELAERIGATWSTGFYWYSFASRPSACCGCCNDVVRGTPVRTSAGLARTANAIRARRVRLPSAAVLLQRACLAALKLLGVDVVFLHRQRAGAGIHRRAVAPRPAAFVTRFVPNSRFSYGRLQETGVPRARSR